MTVCLSDCLGPSLSDCHFNWLSLCDCLAVCLGPVPGGPLAGLVVVSVLSLSGLYCLLFVATLMSLLYIHGSRSALRSLKIIYINFVSLLTIYLPIYLTLYLAIYWPDIWTYSWLSTGQSIWLSTYYLPDYLSGYLPVYLHDYLHYWYIHDCIPNIFWLLTWLGKGYLPA